MFDYSQLIAAEWEEALRGSVCTGDGTCVSAEEGQRCPPAAISSLPGRGSQIPEPGQR